ncbi:MAG: methylamine utilization protein [Paucibacter sp.]|nr:methylamine utilization protein [Roseateles sp.]
MKKPALFALLLLPALAAQALPWTVQVKNAAGQPLVDAVVAVELRGKPSHTTSAKAEMGQRDRQFTPQLLVVQTGTAVSFPNFDTVRHHVYSFSPIKSFEIRLYAGTPAAPVTFDKPGVATLGCNIHDRMSARIVVVDTPLFARTDAKGQATLDLPPGDHELQVWHATLRTDQLQSRPLTVGNEGGTTSVTLGD